MTPVRNKKNISETNGWLIIKDHWSCNSKLIDQLIWNKCLQIVWFQLHKWGFIFESELIIRQNQKHIYTLRRHFGL